MSKKVFKEINEQRLKDEYFNNINLLEQKILNNETDVKIAYLTFDDGPYVLTTNYLFIKEKQC